MEVANFSNTGYATAISTASGPVTVTLPPPRRDTMPDGSLGPEIALPACFCDAERTFGTNALTILPGAGQTIAGHSSLILDITGQSVFLVYVPNTDNWLILNAIVR